MPHVRRSATAPHWQEWWRGRHRGGPPPLPPSRRRSFLYRAQAWLIHRAFAFLRSLLKTSCRPWSETRVALWGSMAQSSTPFLRIGTRGSPLALWQAREVRAHLAATHGVEPEAIAIEAIRTTGDVIQDRPLSEAGGKGLFTKEIEQALLDKAIDLAVHSSKDMPTALPAGLELAACLPREDVRDAFISRKAISLTGLPHGAVVGTASLRRQAMVKRLRPDVTVVTFRGNVDTRLTK